MYSCYKTIKYLNIAHIIGIGFKTKILWDPFLETPGYNCVHPFLPYAYYGVATVRESKGKTKNFQSKGKVRKFFKKSGKIVDIVKVS